jgi:hypothetical protein
VQQQQAPGQAGNRSPTATFRRRPSQPAETKRPEGASEKTSVLNVPTVDGYHEG